MLAAGGRISRSSDIPMDSMTLDPASKRRFVVVLGFLTGMGAVSVDMSLAAIPSMAPALDTSISAGQQIVGVFLLGIGLGQLPAGLMADRVGRIPVILAGVGVFTVAGVATALAPSIEFMLVARFVQGLGASVGVVVSRAIVRDIASGTEAARILSLMVMIFTIGPMFAPIVGGYLVAVLGWRAPFALVAVFGALMFLIVLVVLPETGTSRRRDRMLRQLSSSAAEFFSHRRSRLGLLLIVLPAMGFMTVISSASSLIIEIYGYSPGQFGFIFALAGVSILLGSLINRRLLLRLNTLQMIGVGAVLIGAGALQLLLIAWLNEASIWWLWGCVCLYLSGFSFIVANATAMALDPVPTIAGASASIIGTIQSTLASGSAIVAAMIYDGTIARSVLMMGCFGSAALLVFLGRSLILREPPQSASG